MTSIDATSIDAFADPVHELAEMRIEPVFAELRDRVEDKFRRLGPISPCI
ncbi:STAS domain-containing protein [Alsobacter sp. R-9]